MKKLSIFLAAVFLSVHVFAQTPERISYQAVIRDASDDLVSDQNVSTQISILKGSASGTAVYVETHTAMTNANGLLSLQIGSGSPLSGSFSSIDWSSGSYYLKMETDPTGGSNYTITSLSQMLSVPYSLHAKSANKITGYGTAPGQMLYWDGNDWKEITPPTNYVGAMLTMSNNSTPFWINGAPQLPNDFDIVVSPTGRIWLDRNLGASQVASTSTDNFAYGDLYQWGRGPDGHQLRTSETTNTVSTSNDPGHNKFIMGNNWRSGNTTSLWQGINGINNPCPQGFRIPTEEEWTQELNSWISKDAAGAFGSPLKLTLSGYRSYGSGDLVNVDTQGTYASSTPQSATVRSILSFENSSATINTNWARGSGTSVRCIKN